MYCKHKRVNNADPFENEVICKFSGKIWKKQKTYSHEW